MQLCTYNTLIVITIGTYLNNSMEVYYLFILKYIPIIYVTVGCIRYTYKFDTSIETL